MTQALLAISVLCFLVLIWVALSIARYMNASHRRGVVADEMPSIIPRTRQRESRNETEFSQVLAKAIGQQSSHQPHAEPATPIPTHPRPIADALPEPKFEQHPEFNLPEIQAQTESWAPQPSFEDRFARAAPTTSHFTAQPVALPDPKPASKSSAEPDEAYHASIAARISQLQQRAAELQQNVHDISSNKSWNMPLKSLRHRTPVERTDSNHVDFSLLRDERRAANVEALTTTKSAPSDETAAMISTPIEADRTSDTRFVIEAGTEASRKPPQPLHRGVAQRLDRAYAVNQDAGDLTDPYQIPRAGLNSGLTSTKQVRS
jgi:hypothetical protein